MLAIATRRTILEDQSEVFDLLLSNTDDGSVIEIPVGSEEGAAQIVATINNHALYAVTHNEITARY